MILAGLVAARLAGARAGAIGAWLAAVYPPLVWVASYAWSEAIAWPLGLLVVWWFDRATATRDAEGWKPAAIAGGLTGLAILIRPSTILFAPLALAWLAWRRRLTLALAFGLSAAAIVTPWTLRNVAEYGRFVLVATEGGAATIIPTADQPHSLSWSQDGSWLAFVLRNAAFA